MLGEGMMQPLRGKGGLRGKAERLPSVRTRVSHPKRRRSGKDHLEDRRTGAKVVHLRNAPVYTGTRLFGARERNMRLLGQSPSPE